MLFDRLDRRTSSRVCPPPTAQFRHLNQRVTMLQEEILDLRRQQQQERDSRGQGWWAWVGSMGKGPSS